MTDEREATIRSLLPMVRRLALRMHRTIGGSDFDDLFGDGCVGLIRSVDAYDPSRGTSLIGYARPVVIGSMLNGIRRRDPVSERVRRTIRFAEELRFALASERGHLPTNAELEHRMPGLHKALVSVARQTPLSLEGMAPGSTSPPDWSQNPARIVTERERAQKLRDALDRLPARHRSVVLAHYFGGASLRSLSARMAVSPQRISQIHQTALDKMRQTIGPAP